MQKEHFDLMKYFERIKYEGSTEVNYDTLYNIHVNHALHIPFENLDAYYHKPIFLDREAIFKKLVLDRRGGYCFEMNGLLSAALKELGFKVTDLLARATMDGINFLAKLHHCLMVELEGKRWLVDVGFGTDGMTAPVLLQENFEQQQFAHSFRILQDIKLGYILQKKFNEEYKSLYAFTLEECYPMDYVVANYFTSTFPESFFVQVKFCTRPTKEGRITLTNDHLKITEFDRVIEKKVEDDKNFNELMKQYFNLDIKNIQSE